MDDSRCPRTHFKMQQFLEIRFATYYPILKFSKINIPWTKAHSILILRLKVSYSFVKYLVIFQKKSVQITETFIFRDFSKFLSVGTMAQS